MSEKAAKGKTFLITGAASGLGARYAEEFLKEGAEKVAIVDINVDVGRVTTQKLNDTYRNQAVFFKCDVSKEEDIAATFDQVVATFGRVDVLINNAGIMSDNPNIWRKACDVNWQGLVSFTMRAQKHMRKDEGGAGGTIINISSTAGVVTFKNLPIYCGSKTAVLHFSSSISEPPFFDQTGVRFITMCFGPTDTPLLHGLKERSYNEKLGQQLEDEYEEFKKQIPPQKPESAVAAIVKAFKEGGPRSVWLSVNDNVGKDITSVVQKHNEEYLQLVMHGSCLSPLLLYALEDRLRDGEEDVELALFAYIASSRSSTVAPAKLQRQRYAARLA
ncbi:short chain dehydrogenase domain-containing protein [Phthorimaea operculella]|nr:short chain dehydrogenase domain-containing protein [Phthorimaea operculella]